MKKAAICGIVILAASAFAQGPRGGGPGGGFGPMGRGMGTFGVGPQSLVTGAPYSAVEVVQTTEQLADGNRIANQHQTSVYRDGQGRIRTEETITPAAGSGKQAYTVATILDYVGGFRYVLDSSTMTAFQSPLRTPPAQPSLGAKGLPRRGPENGQSTMSARPNRPQVASSSLAPQSVNGVLAAGTQHVETIPAGTIGNAQAIQISRVVWMSNDLKVPVQIRSSDPRFGTTSMDLTNIIQGEPSASMFVVPAGYTVQKGGRGGGFGGPGGGPGGRPGGAMRGPHGAQ